MSEDKTERRVFTLGELRRELALYKDDPDSTEVTFSGVLTFGRIKTRGPNRIDFEFHELIYRDSDGKLRLQSNE